MEDRRTHQNVGSMDSTQQDHALGSRSPSMLEKTAP